MKSPILVGLGLLAFGTGAAWSTRLVSEDRTQPAPARTPESYFRAIVRGADSASPIGRIAFGAAGRPEEPGATFTITLGAHRSGGAIVFTRLGGSFPRPGRYPIGQSAGLDSAGGFRALYLAGSATRPRGVFRADAGTIEITSAGTERISGHFELSATGFLAAEPEDETRQVSVSGAFTGSNAGAAGILP